MDYQTAETQAQQLQQQAEQVAQQIKDLAEKLSAKVSDTVLARELALDLREAALAIEKQNEATTVLIDQMAQYIHSFETHINSVPQTGFQTRGWASQLTGGGGFMGNIVSGLGMGAGFGLANDIVGGLLRGI
jgi:predicted ATP-dependent serine protease